MSRFYLNLHQCDEMIRDEEGVDLPDLDAALRQAHAAAREIMAAEILSGRLCLGCRIDIEDGAGQVLAVISFKDTVDVAAL